MRSAVTSHGGYPIKMGKKSASKSDDYAAALAQGGDNQYVFGLSTDGIYSSVGLHKHGIAETTPNDVKASRSPQFGNPNIVKPGDALSNFAQPGSAANMPGSDVKEIVNTTGNVELKTSSTKNPNQDSEINQMAGLDSTKLAARMDLYKNASYGSNIGHNLNDLSAVYRLG